MPSANDAGASNGLLQRWEEYYAQEAAKVQALMHPEGSEEPSAGTNSSTSASTPDKSGPSPQDTASSDQSPALSAESPSPQGPQADQAQSSTVSSTSGSTQETGTSQAGQPDSSADFPVKTATTQAHTENPQGDAEELVDAARKAYNDKNYQLAKDLIAQAEFIYPPVKDSTGPAHQAIDAALAATTQTTTE